MITYHCSKCNKVLEEIGIPPQIQMLQMYKKVVNIGPTEVPEEIKNDPYLYRGFFCPNCNKAFCPQCSHMQGEICPECGQRGLMPAYRPLLKKIVQKEAGLGVASTTSSKGTPDVVLQMVRPFLKTCELMVSTGKGSYHVTATAPDLMKAWESLLHVAQALKPTDESMRVLQMPNNPTWADALSAGRAIESAFSSGASKKWWQFMNWYLKVLKKYAVFSGRARRKEYWMFFLLNIIIAFVLGFVEGLAGSSGIVAMLYSLAILVPGIAVSVRRLHDTDRSGWLLLIALVPIVGVIVLLVFMVQNSKPGKNQYGANPKTDAA